MMNTYIEKGIKVIGNKFNAYISKLKLYHILQGEGDLVSYPGTMISANTNSKITINGCLKVGVGSKRFHWNRSRIRLDSHSEMVINGNSHFMYEADIILFEGAKFILGSGSYINSYCTIRCHELIKIGDGCAISHHFTVMDSDAHSIGSNAIKDPIRIGNHVWIGTGVTILKGVTIGEGAVVAAGAVVTKDVAPKTLVGGVPAKVIRENINWE